MARPKQGHIKFAPQVLAKLPYEGTLSEYAAILGVTPTTVRNWVLVEHGVRVVMHGRVMFLHRESLVNWLRATGRCSEEPVFDYTGQVKLLGQEAQDFVQHWSSVVPLSAVFVSEFLQVLEAERKRF